MMVETAMIQDQGFRRPLLRPNAVWQKTSDGAEVNYLDGRRLVEFEFDADRREDFYRFLDLLARSETPAGELRAAFPGSDGEWRDMLDALDEQGMLAEGLEAPAGGYTGVGAYPALRRLADEVRDTVRSPLYAALESGEVTREQIIGYAIEYWQITHLCPRVVAPVLARDDFSVTTWQKLMSFYMTERNHDRMLEKSLKAVGVSREQLLRSQPLPATMAIMAALGVDAYQFPLALITVLFPMEEPEPDFLELLVRRSRELGLPEAFIKPIMDHSDVNDDEAHDAVTLDILADFPFVGEEELRECGKAVADVIEQRARLDAEILQWYATGGVRDFSTNDYPLESGRALTCAPLTSLA
ncbi:iron-containing redox enzyme family protein [Micromonospora sp. DT4]|uniref:iron-containing redox enzyme family protein n=1 Tax=Micromonospora sp. DT4 TaxID=3393438 RepID=UPI003CF6B225